MDRMSLENNMMHRKLRESNLIIHNLKTPITMRPMASGRREDTITVEAKFMAYNQLLESITIEEAEKLIAEAYGFGTHQLERSRSILY